MGRRRRGGLRGGGVKPLTKLVLFAVILLGAFGAGAALGAALPDLGPDQPTQQQHGSDHS
jgi:hypothetical protein